METNQISPAESVQQQIGISKLYELMMPITLKDGSQLKLLSLRRPTAKEMRSMPLSGKLDLGVILDMLGRMCGLHPDEVDLIDGADCIEIAGILAPFLERAPGATL